MHRALGQQQGHSPDGSVILGASAVGAASPQLCASLSHCAPQGREPGPRSLCFLLHHDVHPGHPLVVLHLGGGKGWATFPFDRQSPGMEPRVWVMSGGLHRLGTLMTPPTSSDSQALVLSGKDPGLAPGLIPHSCLRKLAQGLDHWLCSQGLRQAKGPR